MADNTIITQGIFTSDGNPVELVIRSDVDWIKVRNLTQISEANDSRGLEYYWQRGMLDNDAVILLRNAAATAVDMSSARTLGTDGFTLFDGSDFVQGGFVVVTGITNGTPPVVETGNTAGLLPGDTVRIMNVVGAQQLGAMDFTIGTIVPNTSFTLEFMQPIANANPGAGHYRAIISGNNIFYPRRRWITNISQAGEARITMSVTHDFTVGQEVRIIVPQVTTLAFGMTEMNGLQATVVAVGEADADGYTNTIDVNIDSSAFTAFAFPLTADVPFSPALVVPIGEDTGFALTAGQDILADATVNQAALGIKLGVGAGPTFGPAGQDGDVIMWVAGKSFSNTPFGD